MTEYDPRVDPARCIGCGLCPDMLPEVFVMRDYRGAAVVHDKDGWKPDKEALLQRTAANCPVGAIHIDVRDDGAGTIEADAPGERAD